VEVKKGNYAIPPMGAAEREIYERTARRQQDAYSRLTELPARRSPASDTSASSPAGRVATGASASPAA
jgi:hypothetical protein